MHLIPALGRPLGRVAAAIALTFAPAAAVLAQDAAPAEVQLDTPAMWKVADEDTTIYLFGTVHVLPEGLNWFHGDVKNAFDTADVLVAELGPESDEPASYISALTAHALLPQGTVLQHVLSADQAETYAKEIAPLEPTLAEIGLPPEMLNMMRPWFGFMTVTVARYQDAGLRTEHGVESVLREAAQQSGKERAGLETLDFQFGLFSSLPQETQVDLLMEALEEKEAIAELIPKLTAAWRAGDVEALAKLTAEEADDEADRAFNALFLDKRNEHWAGWIDERLDTTPGTFFVAVGAAHLAGENSVQDYLAKRDITVTRVQ